MRGLPLLASIFVFENAHAELCKNWSAPAEMGILDHASINESSGLAISRNFENRMYHVNDHGNGPYFIVSDSKGSVLQKVEISGEENSDIADYEDLAVGPCGGTSCLFIGDIGDNDKARSSIKVIVVEEKQELLQSAAPQSILELRYPDGAHNAEGLAVHPNGDIYIFTKEEGSAKKKKVKEFEDEVDGKKKKKKKGGTSEVSQLFVVKKAVWESAKGKPIEMVKVGEIDIATLAGEAGALVTSFDISADGSKFALLTYKNALEFSFDFSSGQFPAAQTWKAGENFQRLPINPLAKQEALAFTADGSSLIYTTESPKQDSPFYEMTCTTAQ